MRLHRSALAVGLALSLAACGQDEPTKATGPVTLKFATPLFTTTTSSARDTSFVEVTLDGAQTVQAPMDSITNVARGEHDFEAHFDIDYLPSIFKQTIDPRRSTQLVVLKRAGTCRIFSFDQEFCIDNSGVPRNVVYWSQHKRLICPTSDFGEFCSTRPDGLRSPIDRNVTVGLNWPSDVSYDTYVTQAKLLIAATVGTGLADAGKKIATALYTAGDYSPRERLKPFSSTDSSRYTNVVWTDARHVPLWPNEVPFLADADRPSANFGLQVRITYFQSPQYQDVLFARFDVKNITTEVDYRRVHPESPAAGVTVRDVYLAPVIDADIGGPGASGVEAFDDMATVFPADSLVAAYDTKFNVTTFTDAWALKPALVGMRLIDTDVAGTAKALLLGESQKLDYREVADEQATHAALAAGRDGSLAGCTSTAIVFNCLTETNNDVRIGWSVGPIASLAPGESRTITVAILLAEPKAGAFTTGTAVAPQNGALDSTTRPIYTIAEALRALANQIKSQRVTP